MSVAPSILTEATSTTMLLLNAEPDNTSLLLTFSTLPDARLMFSEDPQLSPVASKFHVLSPSPESTVIPAPSATESSADPVAIRKFLSSILTVVELTVVVVPSTWKSPAITTLPVLSPTPAGSRVMVAGPEMVLDVTLIADPSAPVWNAEAVTVEEAFTVPVTPNSEPLKVRLPLSSSSPPEPAITTLLSVRSSTTNVLAVTPPLKSAAPPTVAPPVTVSPEAMLAPPSTSRAPVTVAPAPTVNVVAFVNVAVAIPLTFIALKLAPCPPPRT